MSNDYNASAIEVLSGLDPVRRGRACTPTPRARTTSPRRSIDNSVDEAIAGHCKKIDGHAVPRRLAAGGRRRSRHAGGRASGRRSIPGVELILTRLHAGGKFSNKNYQFSGGLHGVGVSVVNALSSNLEVLGQARRAGIQHELPWRRTGQRAGGVGTVGKRNTGTTIRFWPDEKYFDSAKISRCRA